MLLRPLRYLILLFVVFSSCKNRKDEKARIEPYHTAHTSQNSLDWEGIYVGTLECPDCDGIRMLVALKRDKSFVLSRKYEGKSDDVFTFNGTYSWLNDGNHIELDDPENQGQKIRFQVAENHLFLTETTENVGNKTRPALIKQRPQMDNFRWTIRSMTDERTSVKGNRGKQAFIEFQQSGKNVSANAGCNSMSGVYRVINDSTRVVDGLGATKMLCENMEAEHYVNKLLQGEITLRLKSDELEIRNKKENRVIWCIPDFMNKGE